MNYEDWKRRVSCGEIIQEFYDASNAKDTLPMITPNPTHEPSGALKQANKSDEAASINWSLAKCRGARPIERYWAAHKAYVFLSPSYATCLLVTMVRLATREVHLGL